ncbi:peptidoglycan-binding domain-containing protein [uncultured Pseudoteredinibacter sp.]|uniref:peptidoglycan-binding domain-containing protein n=1 Tax=uncultured Pseudoteredinibacter sp. TaxID=1641701 RepID=UPI002629DF9C|nr:peptidoglycan-binding domain-containing protein [uncultured Pseudoteredinibacter sp.]
MYTKKLALTATLLSLGACSSVQQDFSQENAELKERLKEQTFSLEQREQRITDLNAELSAARSSGTQSSQIALTDSLLPPNAKSGECYARVWVEPQYRTITESYVAREASEEVSIQPAVYDWDVKSVLVKEATEKRIAIPAEYGFEEQTIKVSDGVRQWRTKLSGSAPKANQNTLEAARRGGINLDTAPVNSCYHEHYIAPEYTYETERVLVSEASEKIELSEPVFETVEERVLVKEATTKLITVPATYETVTEQVLDKPAHTVWKKGTGPIQRIDAATGEIMCLVEVPATYKAVSRRVLKTAATTKTVEVPAEYKTVKVRRQVSAAQENRISIPAKYKDVKKRVLAKDGSYVWHEVHDKTMSKESRTGQQICLTEEAPQYKTVKRRVVTKAAGFRTETIPAVYKDVKVRKLVSAAKEIRNVIPAIEKTVSRQELLKKGQMEWRSILCETNMTTDRLRQIQVSLDERGYNPGKIDGVIGRETMEAVNKFQRDKDLPVDRYLNIETLQALGVSAK